jgi:UDPglucose 6-dehydrogenase
MELTAVIGMGKVGIPLATALASRGVRVAAFDRDPVRRALLREIDLSHPEIAAEGLGAILARRDLALTVSESMAEALAAATIAFVIVPTPSTAGGSFSLDFVEDALREMAPRLRERDSKLLVVLVSTVSPGSVDGAVLPLLTRLAGGPCGSAYNFCYSPALIALDHVVLGFLQPDFAFVGEVDAEGADRLENYYRQVLMPGTPLRRMSAQSVEVAKLALNNFLTLKISFANLVGHLCSRTPGADAADVLDAMGSDSRIGARFLMAGAGFGGPCLPRDNAALAAALEALALPTALPQAALALNRTHAALLIEHFGLNGLGRVGILGLGYKGGSRLADDAFAVSLANALHQADNQVAAYDPLLAEMDLRALDPAIRTSAVPDNSLAQLDALILTDFVPGHRPFLDALSPLARLFDLSAGGSSSLPRPAERFGTGA